MVLADGSAAIKISHGPCQSQDPVMRATAESPTAPGFHQKVTSTRLQLKLRNLGSGCGGIGSTCPQSLTHPFPGGRDPCANCRRTLAVPSRHRLGVWLGNTDNDVDAVGESAAQRTLVAGDCSRRTLAFRILFAPATGTGVGRRNQGEVGGQRAPSVDSGNADFTGFQRLPEGLQCRSPELAEFVKEKHTSVSESDLTWPRRTSPADEAGS